MSLLEIRNLKTYFNSDDGIMPSVDGVSLSLNEGEILGLVGESGCGKTVLSLSIIRMVTYPGKIVSGEIIFDGEDLVKKSQEEMTNIRGDKIAMIFQDPMTSLNPVFNIDEQMTMPLMVHKKLSKNDARKQAVEMLKKVGIAAGEKRIFEYPHQFSGGQRQRILIGTALSLNPTLLIADEPTTALDVSVQAQILQLLSDLQKEFKTTMIFISHDLGVIAGISHKVAVMYGGWIVEEAPSKEIFNNACHPYTKALLNALPSITDVDHRLNSLPGHPPVAGEVIEGCKLYPRCPEKIEGKCNKDVPGYYYVKENHRVRCFLYEEAKNA